jgi:membrane fusion protein (multidrug efflux system)
LTLADGTVHPEKGKFVLAERAVDLATGTLTLESEFSNPTGVLRPGQFGRVRVIVEKVGGAVLIPRRAVMEQQSAKVVYVAGADGKVEMRLVQLGERDGDLIVVKDGVKAGEKVIVEGQAKARPGQTVTIADPAKETGKTCARLPAGACSPALRRRSPPRAASARNTSDPSTRSPSGTASTTRRLLRNRSRSRTSAGSRCSRTRRWST